MNFRAVVTYTCPETGSEVDTGTVCDDPSWKWRLVEMRHLCAECGQEHHLVRPGSIGEFLVDSKAS